MKKYLLLLVTAIIILNGCTKIPGTYVNPTVTVTTGTSGGGTTGGTGTTTTDTYQPFTANSYWIYRQGTSTTDSSRTLMTGATTMINGKTYHNVTNTATTYSGSQTAFYLVNNHLYSLRATTLISGYTIELVYLNDALAVGSTWTSKMTDSGFINGIAVQTVGTILDAGISRTVNGKVYNDVIHTRLDVQYDFGTGYQNTAYYEFYVAKNIGVIETAAGAFGVPVSSSFLVNYSIK